MTTENTAPLKNVGIQQLSISYHAPEDRLLLRIGMSNHSEIVVWLTRRVAKSLSGTLNSTPLMATPIVSDAAAQKSPQIAQEMTKNAVTQNLDFSTQYQPRKRVNSQQLFLVHECKISTTPKNKVNLELRCTNKQSINLVLNDDLLMGMTNMLQLATRQAEWDFTLSSNALLPSQDNSNRVLH